MPAQVDTTMVSRKILMLPGPTETYPEALAEMALPTWPHYGLEWGRFYDETCGLLKRLFNTQGDVLILTASGTAASEMCLSAVAEPGSKILVLSNGFFCERFDEIALCYGAKPIDVRAEYGKPIDPRDVCRALMEHGDVKAVCMVHNETSVGVLNPAEEISEVVSEFNIPLIVDEVSALGGVDVRMDEWNVDLAFASSPKGLGAPPVLGLVAVSPRMWRLIAERKQPIQGFYLNLSVWRRYMDSWGSFGHPYPASAATGLIRGLRKALELVLEEGLEDRFRRHMTAAAATRAGLKALGLELFADEGAASPTVTTFRVPQGVKGAALRKRMEEKYHIVLGGGVGQLSQAIIRIGHMAMTASPEYVLQTLAALESALIEEGFPAEHGAGTSAAGDVFRNAAE
ncbi:MAG: alanine--glyoxylate aminotransferase family protein [Candidatus Bathyarchaeia archaeon]